MKEKKLSVIVIILIVVILGGIMVMSSGAENPQPSGTLSERLLNAVRAKSLETAEKLIKDGADVNPVCENYMICSPIVYAAENGDIAMMKMLMGHGADVNAKNAYDNSPLVYALVQGQIEAVDVLLEAGANVNQPNAFGATPFMGGCGIGDLELVKKMLARGGDPNAGFKRKVFSSQTNAPLEGADNITALMVAAKAGKKEVVALLLEHGGKPGVTDSEGKNAADYALEAGHDDIAALLKP